MTITTELKQAVARAGKEPVRVEDPEENRAYVLIAAEEFERMRALLSDDPVEQMAPFLDETFGEGWDDPALDAYNHLKP